MNYSWVRNSPLQFGGSAAATAAPRSDDSFLARDLVSCARRAQHQQSIVAPCKMQVVANSQRSFRCISGADGGIDPSVFFAIALEVRALGAGQVHEPAHRRP